VAALAAVADDLRMTTIPVTQPAEGRLRLLPRVREMAHDFAYLVAGLPVGVAAFSLILTGLATAAGLAITLAGIPILLVTLLAARGIAEFERRRAAPMLRSRIHGREREITGSLWERTKAISTDPASWRDTAWSLLLLPIGVAGFTAAVTLWSVSLSLVASPLYFWALDNHDDDLALFNDPSLGYSALRVVIGVALIPVAAWGSRAVSVGTAKAAKSILG
jgi:Putative sensor